MTLLAHSIGELEVGRYSGFAARSAMPLTPLRIRADTVADNLVDSRNTLRIQGKKQ